MSCGTGVSPVNGGRDARPPFTETMMTTSLIAVYASWLAAGVGPSSPSIEEDFFVTLPRQVRPLPEPLPEGEEPGFAIRGTKGWMWRPEQYLAEIPVLVKYKLNFLMNCYTSMCDVEHFRWGDPQCNRWWEPIPQEKARAYENVARECLKAGVRFCFSMNPNICTKRIVDYNSAEDVDLLWRHYSWMQGLGVKWFNISLDDITEGIDAAGQAKVVNEIFRRLREKDAEAAMIFCPTFYWGTGEDPKAAAYLETLARDLHPDVYVFWTGGAVVGRITRADAETYKGRVRHRIIVWDNYPVNDAAPTMHLGPVIYRDRDLCKVVDGIMGNPLCPQNEINRIPLLTLADYAWNPEAYDPARSIGQAIVHLADTPPRQRVLKELVELYPGTLLESKGTGWNPVIARFNEILDRPHSRYLADVFLKHAEDVAQRMEEAFPERFKDALQTLLNDIAKMNAAYAAKYARSAN